MVSEEFTKMIDMDIESLHKALADRNNSDTLEYAKLQLYREVTAKYHSYVPNLGDGLYCFYKNLGSYDDVQGEALFHNLQLVHAKLLSFRAAGYPSLQMNRQGPYIQIDNKNSNENTNNLLLNISFESVIKQIEGMTALSAKETDAIIDKINELENIINSNEGKKKKWDKIKPFLLWVSDKSVDVGLALLPLLLKIN